MRLAVALVILAAQTGPSPPAPEKAEGEVQRELEFEGTPQEAMRSLVELSAGSEPQRAFAIAQQFVGDETLPEPLRAEFHFAGGVVRHASGMKLQALASFGSARALAGPGVLRLDATYDLGTTRLELAEMQLARAKDPTTTGAPGLPTADGEEIDWLTVAESSYLMAKEVLVERLRTDWRDPDTRANLELIQRRLREIEELREEQEEQQDESQDGEPSDDPQESEDGQDGEPQNPEEEQQPDMQPEGGDEEGDATDELEQDPAEMPEELPEPQESQPGEGSAERRLSREEVMRLLETLEGLDEEARKIEALLRENRRVPVEKDW